MERLNWHMADELSKNLDIRVIGPRGAISQKPPQVYIKEAPLKPLFLFLLVAFVKSLWQVIVWKPHAIIAGSGLTAPIACVLGKVFGIKSVVYLHGLDITVNNIVYQKLWLPILRSSDQIIVNSSPTKELAISAGISAQKITIVFPGVTINESYPDKTSITNFKTRYGLENKKILLSVGRLTLRKGILEFVEKSLPNVINEKPETLFVIIGETPKNALGSQLQNQEGIEQAANKMGIKNHVLFLGSVDEETLKLAFCAADIHVFPIRYIKGDPEGFGMVAIEAASFGLPTIAFATGGVVDAVKNNISGNLVEPENYPALSRQIINSLNSSFNKNAAIEYAKQFSWGSFGQQIHTVLNKKSG